MVVQRTERYVQIPGYLPVMHSGIFVNILIYPSPVFKFFQRPTSTGQRQVTRRERSSEETKNGMYRIRMPSQFSGRGTERTKKKRKSCDMRTNPLRVVSLQHPYNLPGHHIFMSFGSKIGKIRGLTKLSARQKNSPDQRQCTQGSKGGEPGHCARAVVNTLDGYRMF